MTWARAVATDVAKRGWAVIPNFASPAQVAMLRTGAERVVSDFVRRGTVSSAPSVFTTREQARHSDSEFMRSAAEVNCFFEERAVLPPEERVGTSGFLRPGVDPMKSINKAGHALHERVPEFTDFVHGQNRNKYDVLARALLATTVEERRTANCDEDVSNASVNESPLVVQDMYIFKQPSIGGEVTPHQDSTFLHTMPRMSCFGLWLALDDADETNSCLWAVEGSHRHGIVSRMVRKGGNDDGTTFVQAEERVRAPWASLEEEFGAGPRDPRSKHSWESLCVPSGTLVVLHGSLVHASEPNRSSRSRHAYALHVAGSLPDAAWATDNWLQRPANAPFVSF